MTFQRNVPGYLNIEFCGERGISICLASPYVRREEELVARAAELDDRERRCAEQGGPVKLDDRERRCAEQ